KFFSKLLSAGVTDENKPKQLELAKTAIEKGADINKVIGDESGYLGFRSLYNLQSVLLTPETANKFFSKLLSVRVTDEDKPKQLELAKTAIEKGADINKVIGDKSGYFGFDSLYNLQSILLTPETADKFFSKLLSVGIRDEDKPKQLELAKAAIEKGADINKVFEDKSGYFQLDFLYNLQSVLLTPETANKFFSKILSVEIRDEDKPKQLELAKAAVDMGADINKVFEDKSGYFQLDFLYNLQSTLLTPETADKFLEAVNSGNSSEESGKDKQIELAKAAFDMGADVNSFLDRYDCSTNLVLGCKDLLLSKVSESIYFTAIVGKYYSPSIDGNPLRAKAAREFLSEHGYSNLKLESLAIALSLDVTLLDLLLEQGMSPNYYKDGESLLGEVLSEKTEKTITIVDALIEAGVDLNKLGELLEKYSFSALDLILFTSYGRHIDEDLFEFLLQQGLGNNVFTIPGGKREVKTSDKLIQDGRYSKAALLLEKELQENGEIVRPPIPESEKDIQHIQDLIVNLNAQKDEIKELLDQVGTYIKLSPKEENLLWQYVIIFNEEKGIEELQSAGVKYNNSLENIAIEDLILSKIDNQNFESISAYFPELSRAKELLSKDTILHKIARSGNYEAFIDLSNKGYSPDQLNAAYETPIDILSLVIKSRDDFDEIFSEALEHSNDPFYKDKDIDFSSDKFYMGIPVVKDFWDIDHITAARVMALKHPNIRVVTFDYDNATEEFLSQLNGFMIPGGGDSYPKKPEGFDISDFEPSGKIEQTYLRVYEYAYKHATPLIGMCLGNQYHALSQGESLVEVQKYADGTEHKGYVKTGSMPYFMMMTSEEQCKYLSDENYNPEIVVDISTAHHYAPKDVTHAGKIGILSEEGVVQSYYNGNHVTFQFHPEHYGQDPENKLMADHESWSRQMNIFDNFARMMQQHRDKSLVSKYIHEQQTYVPFETATSKAYAESAKEIDAYYHNLEEQLAAANNGVAEAVGDSCQTGEFTFG
ncbi:MAG: gamma-glutamyl-gamma-aminobutyrate hydrolase family protein, partial [Rickettsiales bacterium]